MSTVLWIVQGILAAVFLGAGLTKVTQPKEKLESKMGWVYDFDSRLIKLIGLLEILAGLALVVPSVLDVAPQLTAWSATGLMVLMLSAAVVHARRKEPLKILPTLLLLALAAVAAWGGFGPHSF